MRIIAGSAKGRKLKSPRDNQIRPTADKVKEALFNIIGADIRGADFLDLFAGSGSMGLEALSRGARVTLVEKSPAALALLKHNLVLCGFKNGFQLLATDSRRLLRELAERGGRSFDFIFADPPYDSTLAQELLHKLPPRILKPGGLLIIEHPRRRGPEHADTSWEKTRQVSYGKISLSFYQAKSSD